MNLLYYGGSDFSSMIGIIIIVAIIYFISKKGNSTLNTPMSTLVLTKFEYSTNLENETLVTIVGRKSGIVGWLLVKLGLGTETTIVVTKTDLTFKGSSLSGESYSLMTLKNIASSHCGYSKPVALLIIGILLVIVALITMTASVGTGFVILIVAAICFVLYYFKKEIRIMVQTKGGGIFGMCFSPSFIENVNVNMEEAKKVVELINSLMIAEQQK
ncbi:hypothetical protein [uncultured Bacteroides sp.]|uniref:hypothetical protein n=1 Tax=uncultured Bacteroides sp. TaxID=162156 RepID=UPI00261EFF36|nr:hypothetical protein [uncultured Bacteroides sp.]